MKEGPEAGTDDTMCIDERGWHFELQKKAMRPATSQSNDIMLNTWKFNHLVNASLIGEQKAVKTSRKKSPDDKANANEGSRASNDDEIMADADKECLKYGKIDFMKGEYDIAIDYFIIAEKLGSLEAKFYKGLAMMRKDGHNFLAGLTEAAQACIDSMDEKHLEDLKETLELCRRKKYITAPRRKKVMLDRQEVADCLNDFLEGKDNGVLKKQAAGRILWALRMYLGKK